MCLDREWGRIETPELLSKFSWIPDDFTFYNQTSSENHFYGFFLVNTSDVISQTPGVPEMAVSVVKYLLIVFFVYYQTLNVIAQNKPAPPKTLQDLFNSSSCAKPPFTCPHPQIEFYLYTRTTQKKPVLLDVRNYFSLDSTTFNSSHPTKIIIHGFGGGRNLAPSTDLRNAYYQRGDYNIIIVDYGSLVREPCLSQMQWGPDFCSRCIAQLVRYLRDHPRGVPVESIHVLGYSVGAHIGGLIANHLPDDKLGRITGYVFRPRSYDILLYEWQQITRPGPNRRSFCRCDPHGSRNPWAVGPNWTCGFLCERWIKSARMRHFLNSSNFVVRSYQSNSLLHRVHHNKSRILGSTLRKPIIVPDRMVQSSRSRMDSDGRGYPTYRTRNLLSVNKRTQTVRPRTTRKKATPEKSEAIALPPVLSLLKQLINILIE